MDFALEHKALPNWTILRTKAQFVDITIQLLKTFRVGDKNKKVRLRDDDHTFIKEISKM